MTILTYYESLSFILMLTALEHDLVCPNHGWVLASTMVFIQHKVGVHVC